jgi:hypothetical protein
MTLGVERAGAGLWRERRAAAEAAAPAGALGVEGAGARLWREGRAVSEAAASTRALGVEAARGPAGRGGRRPRLGAGRAATEQREQRTAQEISHRGSLACSTLDRSEGYPGRTCSVGDSASGGQSDPESVSGARSDSGYVPGCDPKSPQGERKFLGRTKGPFLTSELAKEGPRRGAAHPHPGRTRRRPRPHPRPLLAASASASACPDRFSRRLALARRSAPIEQAPLADGAARP